MWDFYSGVTDWGRKALSTRAENAACWIACVRCWIGLPARSYQLSTLYSCVTPDNVLSVFEPAPPITGSLYELNEGIFWRLGAFLFSSNRIEPELDLYDPDRPPQSPLPPCSPVMAVTAVSPLADVSTKTQRLPSAARSIQSYVPPIYLSSPIS